MCKVSAGMKNQRPGLRPRRRRWRMRDVCPEPRPRNSVTRCGNWPWPAWWWRLTGCLLADGDRGHAGVNGFLMVILVMRVDAGDERTSWRLGSANQNFCGISRHDLVSAKGGGMKESIVVQIEWSCDGCGQSSSELFGVRDPAALTEKECRMIDSVLAGQHAAVARRRTDERCGCWASWSVVPAEVSTSG